MAGVALRGHGLVSGVRAGLIAHLLLGQAPFIPSCKAVSVNPNLGSDSGSEQEPACLLRMATDDGRTGLTWSASASDTNTPFASTQGMNTGSIQLAPWSQGTPSR